jgi:hypothetical protein
VFLCYNFRVKLAAILIFLIPSFAVPPNGGRQNIAYDAKHDQKPTDSATVKQQPSAITKQGKAPEDIQGANKQYSVAVKEMPPKEIWDKVYVILTGALVGVGIITLIAIWIQAFETGKATKAMLHQVEIQREALRPRLVIKPATNPYPDMALGKLVLIDVSVINTGGVPAYAVNVETWLEFLELPFVDFTANATHYQGRKISVHPSQPTNYQVPLRRSLTTDEIAKLRAAKATLHLRILLAYNALGEDSETDSTFGITPNEWEICKTWHT